LCRSSFSLCFLPDCVCPPVPIYSPGLPSPNFPSPGMIRCSIPAILFLQKPVPLVPSVSRAFFQRLLAFLEVRSPTNSLLFKRSCRTRSDKDPLSQFLCSPLLRPDIFFPSSENPPRRDDFLIPHVSLLLESVLGSKTKRVLSFEPLSILTLF